MNVLLTSFHAFNTQPYPVDRAWSVAMYQPNWFPRLPTLAGFLIRDESGAWIRPRLFEGMSDPLYRYSDRLRTRWLDHRKELREWARRWPSQAEDVALVCWCPYDKAARRQIAEHGSFVCHTAAIERFINEHLAEEFGLTVIRDADRERMVEL